VFISLEKKEKIPERGRIMYKLVD